MFDDLLTRIGARISYQDSNYRRSIPAEERLSICLRFLATGDSYRTIAGSFRAGISTVSMLIPDVVAAIWDCLVEEFMAVPGAEEWRLSARLQHNFSSPHQLLRKGLSNQFGAAGLKGWRDDRSSLILSLSAFPVTSCNMSSASARKTNPERTPKMGSEMDAAQQLKLKDRQRFFEEVFQHDVDVYLSSAHLSIRDCRRPPIGSISSMEVNVDLLDQMELIDISDQDALDVFFSSTEEAVFTAPLPAQGNNNNDEVLSNGLYRHVLEGLDSKSRVSSTSSVSSGDSQNMNVPSPAEGSEDEEQESSGTLKRRPKPTEKSST
uniref:Transposase n=1 Tax=Knipowitschia caucasica TaxID=637954 RepID=A0AAV2M5T3_KNICA